MTIENSTVLKNMLNLADEICTSEYSLSATEQRYNYHYVFWYLNFTNIISTVCIPFFLLVYLNYKIYIGHKRFDRRQPSNNISGSIRRTRRNEPKKTKMLLFFSFFSFRLLTSKRVQTRPPTFCLQESWRESWTGD